MIAIAALSLVAAPLTLQAAGEAAIAIKNDDPETWVVEYPRLIRPFVQDYRRCLNVANRRVTGVADFENQHRADVPRCAEARAEAITASKDMMRGAKTPMSDAEIETLFENIGRIHVARGADLDRQFTQTLATAERRAEDYEANRPKGLVIELRDASVIKSRLEVEGRDTHSTNENTEAGNAGY
jgi:hypothetical protein